MRRKSIQSTKEQSENKLINSAQEQAINVECVMQHVHLPISFTTTMDDANARIVVTTIKIKPNSHTPDITQLHKYANWEN